MLAAVLQAMFELAVALGVAFVRVFMITCTVFVIVSFLHGDIRINIVKRETEKEKK